MRRNTFVFALLAIVGSSALLACQEERVGDANKVVEQEDLTYKSCVTAEEYATATPAQKLIINRIDGAIAAMATMNRDNANHARMAVINISRESEGLFKNFIFIAPSDREPLRSEATKDGCKICFYEGILDCVSKILKKLDKDGEIDISIRKNSDGCYEISWEKEEVK